MTSEVDLGIDDLSDYQTIGTGGFSTVMSAWDEGFRRRVAIKVIHSLDEAGRRRFERERGIMGQLSSHTNVIMPFRAGYTSTGAPYLVMELVDGGSLEDLAISRGPIPWREAVEYILPVTAALSHAHQQGILHRDVKPANILLAGAVPKLTDFGIAAVRESTASVVAYTLSHCPPETFATGYDNRDERSDLYSMASTLYTLLTGGFAPYDVEEPDSQQAYMFRIIGHDLPELPAELDIPESLRAFLRSALAKDADERPQTAAEFSAWLREILNESDNRTVFGPADGGSATADTLYHQPLDPDLTRPMQIPTPPAPTHITGEDDNELVTRVAPNGASAEDIGPGITGQEPTDHARAEQGTNDHTATAGATSPTTTGEEPGNATEPAAGAGRLNFPPPTIEEVKERVDTGEHEPGTGQTGPSPKDTGSPRPLVGSPSTKPGSTKAATASRPKRPLLPILAAALVLAAVIAGGVWALTRGPADLTPPVAWEFDTKSALASRPAVSGQTLVVGARITNRLHALDTETGEEVWHFDSPGGFDADPTIVDGVVYIGSLGGMMYAINLDDGTVIWEHDVDNAVKGRALVNGGRVYVGTVPAALFALQRETGDEVWVAEYDTDLGFSVEINTAPVAITAAGQRVIGVGVTDAGFYLYQPSTGDLVDRIQLPGGAWFSNPIILDREDGGQELFIGTSNANSGALARINLDDLTVASFENSAGTGTDPALTPEGHIVVGNDQGTLYAVDRDSLGEIWRQGYADQTQIKGSPAIYKDQIIIGTHDNELIAVRSADGTELWRFEGEQVFGLSAPVVVGDALYVGNDSGVVYRLDLG